MKSVKVKAIVVIVGCFIFILFMGFFPRSINVPVHGEGSIHVVPASCLAMWFGGSCHIRYQSNVGNVGNITLAHTWSSAPIIVVPSEDGKVLLCLFWIEDMGLWLVKFDTTKAFGQTSSEGHWGEIVRKEIVRKSSWDVEPGTIDDWRWMYNTIKIMTPDEFKNASIPEFDFGIKRKSLNKDEILSNLKGYGWPNASNSERGGAVR